MKELNILLVNLSEAATLFKKFSNAGKSDQDNSVFRHFSRSAGITDFITFTKKIIK